jgi:type IV pilus assembly protein PilE
MQLRTAARSSLSGGFSLIELMVVVAIATILFAIAAPSYMTYIRQSRRTEARTAVLDLAGREERFFSTNGATYADWPAAANLGYAALPVVVGGGYYTLTVCSPACAPSAVPAPSYTVTATPAAGQSQTRDLQCASFSVDSTGRQFATDSTGADATQFCWAN